MQEHTDDKTVRTTGRGYNRQTTDPERSTPTGVASDLYAPVPGDDDDTRPGMVGSGTPATSRNEPLGTENRSMDAVTTEPHLRDERMTPRSSSAYTMGSETKRSDGGIMQTVQDNPLAVVAAATVGGMLLGRLTRRRSHRRDEGYLRRAGFGNEYGYQGYRSPQPYRQATFSPYPANTGDPRYQGYGAPGGYWNTPQYRPEQEFQPEQGFQGRHENFPGGSNWD